jgi:hypothetical protein
MASAEFLKPRTSLMWEETCQPYASFKTWLHTVHLTYNKFCKVLFQKAGSVLSARS